jgi:hypothetical protein
MVLSASTIFLSAFLLFQVQPMIAKMILPWFGGSAAVWITAMLFFQTVLLGGYLYAHWLVRKLAPKGQAAVHVALLVLSLLFLPVMPSSAGKLSGSEDPVLRILGLLVVSVGLPYFLLSTTSPLIQAWYARRHRTALPYRFFALSNLASLAGLLAYPFLVEPNVTLRQQSLGWSGAYGVFVLFGTVAAITGGRAVAPEAAPAAVFSTTRPISPAPGPSTTTTSCRPDERRVPRPWAMRGLPLRGRSCLGCPILFDEPAARSSAALTASRSWLCPGWR